MNKKEKHALWATRAYSVMYGECFCGYTIKNGCKEMLVFPFGDDRGEFVNTEPSFSNALHKIGINLIKNHKKILSSYPILKKKILQLSKILSSKAGKIPDNEILKTYNRYWKYYKEFQPYMMFPHFMEREFEPFLRNKFKDNFDIIATTPMPFEHTLMQKDMFTLTLKQLVKKYAWFSIHAMTEEPLDEKYIIDLKKTLDKRKVEISFEEIAQNNKIYKAFTKTLSRKDQELCRIMREFMYIRTDRIDVMRKHFYILYPFFNYLASKIGPNLGTREASMLSRKEITEILTGKFCLGSDELYQRGQRKDIVVKYDKHGVSFIKDRDKISRLKEKYNTVHDTAFVKGVCGCVGITRGIAKIYMKKSDIKDDEKGYILISRHTTPQDINIIRRAKAIVSDEGGMTSHSAIVSRELGIPCIVGAKIATKIFKDGDLVEVDAEKGVIKLIK